MPLYRPIMLSITCIALAGCGNSSTSSDENDLIAETATVNASEDNDAVAAPVINNDNQSLSETVDDVALNDNTDSQSVLPDTVETSTDEASDEASTDNTNPTTDTQGVDSTPAGTSVDAPSPLPPTNLRGVAYTDTEIELFWDRSTDASVTRYRISQDGTELVEIDALSYYDNSVTPGNTFEYTVQSIDNNGNAGAAASIFLTTPAAAPTINAGNADQIIGFVVGIVNGEQFANLIDVASTMSDLVVNNETADNGFVETDRFLSEDEARQIREFNCSSGTFTSGITFNALPSANGEFTDCDSAVYPTFSLNGSFLNWRELSDYVNNPGLSNDMELRELSITHDSGQQESISGDFLRFDGNANSWSYQPITTVIQDENNNPILDDNGVALTETTPMRYTSPAFAGQTTVLVTDISISHGIFTNGINHNFSAEFTVQSPETGNKLITVTTPVRFSRIATNFFTVGQMHLSAADGSLIIIDANTGDSNTVRISMTSDGITTEEISAWTQPIIRLISPPSDF